jgi:hypothetical protein
MKRPLIRVNEKGVNGIWWCEPCLAKKEPELLRNHQEEDGGFTNQLDNILNGKK